jgi:four helix bundle protein
MVHGFEGVNLSSRSTDGRSYGSPEWVFSVVKSITMAFKFENLLVWKLSVRLSGEIHELTATFPADERYVLSSQIRRAADSIALNIAEGSTGQTDREFARFLGIAVRSGIEVICCLHPGRERHIIPEKSFSDLYQKTTTVIKMVQALRKKIYPPTPETRTSRRRAE